MVSMVPKALPIHQARSNQMRLTRFLAAASALSLAACATAGPPNDGSAIAGPNGIDKRYAVGYEPIETRLRVSNAKAGKDLYVTDDASSVFLFKNSNYRPDGAITNGVSDTNSVWVDNVGNVYVANLETADITEFAPGAKSPSCTYASGLVDPVNVTTDSKGNVYVADFNFYAKIGYIDVFAQCTDTIAKQYEIKHGPEGVAVDASGDIFVSFFNKQKRGAFEEFVAGNSTATLLAASVASPGGIILDKQRDIIADDQRGAIFRIPPPYTTDMGIVSGMFDPFRVALSKDEKTLFSANSGSGTVTIYKYPSAKLIKTLGSADGLDGADGVSQNPNDTP
jgi:DNA-binding beta-propeller fold protein YncE